MILVLAAALAAGSSPGFAEDLATYERMLTDKAPSLVTIKFVLKMQSRFGDRENEGEAAGVMIGPRGLVLCSNGAIGGQRFGGATPKNIKILIGDDIDGLSAEFIARDSELDLAWVRVKEPGERKFAFLDLSKSASPRSGQPLMTMRRMSRYFDRAVLISEGRLAGQTAKPRKLYVPGGGLDIEPGLPVFTTDGSVVGIVVVQMPDEDVVRGDSAAFIGAGRDIWGGLILPAAEVLEATARAKEASQEDEDEEDEEDAEEEELDSAEGTTAAGDGKVEDPRDGA